MFTVQCKDIIYILTIIINDQSVKSVPWHTPGIDTWENML